MKPATGASETCRLGIIGVGFGEAVLAPAFLRDPRVRLTAICASSIDRARAAAGRLGSAKPFDDWRGLVASPDVDAVAIAVPPVLQPEIIRAAAKHQKHVFCEKPVGVSREAIRGLADAVAAAGVASAVDFEFVELESWRRARALLQSFGPVRHFALSWRVETRANRLGGHPWKTATARGGGALLGFGPHAVHAVESMLGAITRVSARLEPKGAEADARVDALVELAGGVTGTIAIATDAVHGSGFGLEVYGADRMLLLENRSADHLRNYVLSTREREDAELVRVVDERRSSTEPAPQGDGRVDPVAALARRFVDAALGGDPVRPSLEDGARVTSVLDAMKTSQETGTWETTA